jgi:hypothetical protein
MERHCQRQLAIAERLAGGRAFDRELLLRACWPMGLEAELVRQADLVDVTAGIVNFGLDRRWLRALSGDVSRDGFWRLPGDAVPGELRHRPASLTEVFASPGAREPEPGSS